MAAAEACIPNIGPGERRKRLAFGVVGLALGAGVVVLLCLLAVRRPFRLAAFALFAVGGAGLFQARGKT